MINSIIKEEDDEDVNISQKEISISDYNNKNDNQFETNFKNIKSF